MGNVLNEDKHKDIPNPLELKVGNEWKALEEVSPPPASHFTSALAGENVDKNRYPRVLAPDLTRVKLQPMKGNSDYINANYIDGIHLNSKRAYIATQAPKPETVKDFWRMVWEQDVRILVMLTNLEEQGKSKAHLYWPTHGSKTYGNVTVSIVSVDNDEDHDWCLRKFNIRFGGNRLKQGTTMVRVGDIEKPVLNHHSDPTECRTLYQYHYTAWPDMGVPHMPPLLDMMSSVNVAWLKVCEDNMLKPIHDASPSPIVVHCSAGIGRTGAYMLIHTCVSRLLEDNTPPSNLDLQPILSQMREQRPGLVQQKEQYMFCYKLIQFAIDGVQSRTPDSSPPPPTRKALSPKSNVDLRDPKHDPKHDSKDKSKKKKSSKSKSTDQSM